MVEGVSGNLSGLEQFRLKNEYQEVIDALKKAFPGMTEAALEQAMMSYLEAHSSDKLSGLSVLELINKISESLNVCLSAQAAATIKDEWEDLTKTMDIGVSDLVDVLDSYGQGEVHTSRAYMVMVWEMLQGELEDSASEEATIVAETDKTLQKSKFSEYLEEKLTAMAKARTDKGWSTALKWAGTVASLIGGMVTSAIGGAMMVAAGWTGLGAIAGACMISAGFISMAAGTSALVGLIVETAGHGENWSLEGAIGHGIGALLNLMGADVDEEAWAMWTAIVIQGAMLYASVSLSLAGGFFSLCSAGSQIASSSVKAAADTANVAREAANAAKDAAEIAQVCGDCWELAKAAKEAAAIAAETAKILQLTKINHAMSVVTSLMSMFNGVAGFGKASIQIGRSASAISLAESQADLMAIKTLLKNLSDVRETNQEVMHQIFTIIFKNMRGQVADASDSLLKDLEMVARMQQTKA